MTEPKFIDTLLLLALPASGKSEVRRFMLHTPREQRIDTYHISDTVQLDDFPYVHYFRCIDEQLVARGQGMQFYGGPRERFLHLEDWGTLLQLVNDDYAVMMDPSMPAPAADPEAVFARIDAARARVGGPQVFAGMDAALKGEVAAALQGETDRLLGELFGGKPDRMDDKTLVIEFARGGPENSTMPLTKPYGYGWNLSQLAPELLERAGILYIWVTPEESRRKNIARCDPNDPGSILHHSAPETVMRNDYGCDDIDHLIGASDVKDTIRIEAHGRSYHLPIARFDNRVDKTTFAHGDPDSWAEADMAALHEGLVGPMQALWEAYAKLHS